ncbi:MAG: FkbM family methyltransferase [Synechococcus sp.]|nr:FkbM family methyltransferase [Synechococcus sp.]
MSKSLIRSLPSVILAFFLKFPFIRRRLTFFLRQYYFNELGFKINIGRGLVCPVFHPSATCSLEEIFFENEYQSAFQEINLPNKWLDLGCHYGYFSLYLAWLHAGANPNSRPYRAFLIDADSRVGRGIADLIKLNNLDANISYMHGAISEGSGSVSFKENLVMSSSLSTLDESSEGVLINVPITDQTSIMRHLAPPYDLVKIDVEGAEYDFLLSYKDILSSTSALIIEWHSWHRGGGSQLQIQDMVESYGFRLQKVLQPPKSCSPSGRESVGVLLFTRILT